MNLDEIKEYLVDFQNRALPKLIKRDIGIKESNKIKSIIGPRRAGKTYLLYQIIKEILEDKKEKESISI